MLEALRPERLTEELDPLFTEQVAKWGKKVLADLGAGAAFDLLNPLIDDHVADMAGNRIAGITETTRDALGSSLADGVRAGEDVDALAARVREVFGDCDKRRAKVIARTEVMRSSNWATFEAHRVSGVVSRRQWVETPDDRTRDSHKEGALGGQERGIDEPFEYGGHKAMHPGGFGVKKEDIQCRCTTTAVIEDVEEDPDFEGFAGAVARVKEGESVDRLALWKLYDAALLSWEDDAEAAIRRGFAEQLADVLDALEE